MSAASVGLGTQLRKPVRPVAMLVVAILVVACGSAAPSSPSGSSLPAPSVAATETRPPAGTATASRSPTPSRAPSPSPTVDPLAAVRHTMDDLKADRLVTRSTSTAISDLAGDRRWRAVGHHRPIRRAHRPGQQRGHSRGRRQQPVPEPRRGIRLSLVAELPHPSGRPIDPATNAVVATVPVGGVAGDGEGQLVAAFGSVWLFADNQGTLVRIDPPRRTRYRRPTRSVAIRSRSLPRRTACGRPCRHPIPCCRSISGARLSGRSTSSPSRASRPPTKTPCGSWARTRAT